MELDAGAELDLVLGGVGVRVDHSSARPGPVVRSGLTTTQRVEQVLGAGLVDRRDALVQVQRLGRAAADEAGAERATLDGRAGRGGRAGSGGRGRAAAAGRGQKRRHAEHGAGSPAQQRSTGDAVVEEFDARFRTRVVRIAHGLLLSWSPGRTQGPLLHTYADSGSCGLDSGDHPGVDDRGGWSLRPIMRSNHRRGVAASLSTSRCRADRSSSVCYHTNFPGTTPKKDPRRARNAARFESRVPGRARRDAGWGHRAAVTETPASCCVWKDGDDEHVRRHGRFAVGRAARLRRRRLRHPGRQRARESETRARCRGSSA